jgi:hypothetical protein
MTALPSQDDLRDAALRKARESESFSTHRIQEVHTKLLHVLRDLIHVSRGEEDTI